MPMPSPTNFSRVQGDGSSNSSEQEMVVLPLPPLKPAEKERESGDGVQSVRVASSDNIYSEIYDYSTLDSAKNSLKVKKSPLMAESPATPITISALPPMSGTATLTPIIVHDTNTTTLRRQKRGQVDASHLLFTVMGKTKNSQLFS